jgi:hypothetical protein
MASRTNGAGARLSGVLERTPHSQVQPVEGADQLDGEPAVKGRAVTKKTAGKKIRGRTIYLDDGLFERILVAAHRRDRTISEFVSALLDRHVPNHLAGRSDPVEDQVREPDTQPP